MSASSGTAQFPASACTLGRVGCHALAGSGHVALSWNWKEEGGRDGRERWEGGEMGGRKGERDGEMVDGEMGGGENEEGRDERDGERDGGRGEGGREGGRDGKRDREREKGDSVGKKREWA